MYFYCRKQDPRGTIPTSQNIHNRGPMTELVIFLLQCFSVPVYSTSLLTADTWGRIVRPCISFFPGRQPLPETVAPHHPLLEDYYEDTMQKYQFNTFPESRGTVQKTLCTSRWKAQLFWLHNTSLQQNTPVEPSEWDVVNHHCFGEWTSPWGETCPLDKSWSFWGVNTLQKFLEGIET